MNERQLLMQVCDAYRSILGDKLTGFYVHGSIALGCFTWATGDIDFLVVVKATLTQMEKEALIRVLLERSPDAPPKGFEMSVILRSVCDPFVYPTPFELHFSNAYKTCAAENLSAYCRDMHGVDPDLAAHITVLRKRGETLVGDAASQAFGEVPRACYVDSILADVGGATEEIRDNPVYLTLNLCRVLAFLTEGVVLSKEEGGAWGLTHLPAQYHLLLRHALDAYAGAAFEHCSGLADFAQDMLQRILALTDRN